VLACAEAGEEEPELKQWVRAKEQDKDLQKELKVKSAGREVIAIQEAGAPELVQAVQRELEQELVQERKSASQISELIQEFGVFKASIIYIAFILSDRLPLFEANFRYFYTR